MTDAAQPASSRASRRAGAPSRTGVWTRPLTRALFWTASLGAAAAAAVAVVAGAGAGWHGVVLLSGIAFAALLLMYALAAGDAAGRRVGEDMEASPPLALASEALEALSDPVLITGPGGRVRWANPAYRTLAQAAPSGGSVAPPAPERLFSGAAAGAIYRLARAAASGERGRELLGRVEVRGGESVVYAGDIAPMSDGGAVWRFTPAVEEASVGLDAAPDWAEHAPVGLFTSDGEGRVLAANATLRGWLGARADQALKLADMLAGDGAGAVTRSRVSGAVERIDARLVAGDGAESPVVIAVTWSKDRPARARGVVYALSATGAPQGRAARAAYEAGAAAHGVDDVFASAPFGVAHLSDADPLQAVIVDANPALLQLSGGLAVPGARFADVFDTAAEPLGPAFETALAGRGEPGEAVLRDGVDGRPVHVFLGPAIEGRRAAYLLDITAWKALETRVSQSSKMQAVGQLASGLAHDFNNMLLALRLNVGELLNRHPVGDPSYSDLQQINSVVTRQAGLVKKLLAFSRKQTFRLTVFDLSDVLSDCSIMLSQILEETVKLDIKHGRDLPLVRADRHQIDNILVNLATNARDAMKPHGGVLTIQTEVVDEAAVRQAGAPEPKAGRWAVIHVTDTGAGMDAATKAKIFEPFFTTKAPGEGTGLGLATVYGIVKQTGGFLFVDSSPGEGTAFHIYLPEHVPSQSEQAELAAETEAKAKPVKPSDLAGHGRILLVEDEDLVRVFAAKTLKRRGYEVIEARDGEQALEILEDAPGSFDMLISDVVMPGLDGPSLLKKARPYLGAARIVFMSGYAEEEFSDTLSSDLDISFLPKPFDIQQLAERVKQQLDEARA